MENNKIIIALLVIIIVILAGMILSMTNFMNTDATVEVNNDTTVEETTSDPVVPDTISVELPEYDTRVTKTVGEYTMEAEKWMGGSVGGFEVHLYKNGEPVDKDSYLTRAYFYMDGEWKWSEWGNGEDGYEGYHRYPVAQGVEIQEVEVKF
ncbi:hypothetical protein [Methanobrevibacter sp.]|uniref:hypothetical protein n=1 Tax=Methanobrevibacter sp. TaxID=66852 RepID=UPI0025F33097|nr:hypothetical protein [Methanobrevibacter sp.]MBQ2666091.1 hypothetical protein [Methanobrevibacter sp.]